MISSFNWLKKQIIRTSIDNLMKKIFLIIQREYLSRVRKRTFIVMTILGPILFAAIMVLPAYFAVMADKDLKKIAVADSSKIFINILPESEYVKFTYPESRSLSVWKEDMKSGKYDAVLFISPGVLNSNSVILYSLKQIPIGTNNYISGSLNNIIQDIKLSNQNISPEIQKIIKSTKTDIRINTIRLTEEGKEKKSIAELNMGIGYASGFLIYMFIFLFGAQVMRGVIEEKTSRIVEVVVSSVRPFQLMMGKIVGIALVGLTQFALWVVLTGVIVTVVKQTVSLNKIKPDTEQTVSQDLMKVNPAGSAIDQSKIENNQAVNNAFNVLGDVNIVLILIAFVVYFLGGYLLYGALFAAVGSAVDNETDTQQFMLPITIPLIFGIVIMIQTLNNPDSSLSFWFSIIPFTSPIVMMARLPFGVPPFELALSITLLIITFVFMTWFAAKIYRVGILMYGKKVNYREIWKWVRYHN
jgi:ABC-2 type transport system permease protein